MNEHLTTRPDPMPEGVTTGISGVTFRAVLTATSNEYLAPRLPLTGYVKIVEFDNRGGVQPSGALFMPDREDGGFTSFVHVPDARFEFGTRPVRYAEASSC